MNFEPWVMILELSKVWETMNTGLWNRGPGTQDPVFWGLCCTVAVKIQLIHAVCANAMSLTHGYVLYMVVLLTEGIFLADNTVSNYSLTDPQSSLLSVLQRQPAHTKARESQDYLHLTFDPWTSVWVTSYTCSLVCNKGDYSWVCRVKSR